MKTDPKNSVATQGIDGSRSIKRIKRYSGGKKRPVFSEDITTKHPDAKRTNSNTGLTFLTLRVKQQLHLEHAL